MNQRAIAAVSDAIVPIICEAIGSALEPVFARIKALEAREPQKGEPGKSVDPEIVAQMVSDAVAKLPPAEPGKDADPEMIGAMVSDAVAKLPPAKDGKPGTNVTVDDVAPLIAEETEKAALHIIQNMDVEALVLAAVGKAVSEIPIPKDGTSVTVEDIRPLIDEEVKKAVGSVPAPKDGLGLAGATINRDGVLIVTMTDGTPRELGPVVGKDADREGIRCFIAEKIAEIPRPKDGADGVGFDDMDLVETDDGLVLRFTRGETVKEFSLPTPLDRGVWHEKEWKKGAGVSWGGSWWIAQRDTKAKPDTPDSGWRLAVKRGRDGKDFAPAKSAPQIKLK